MCARLHIHLIVYLMLGLFLYDTYRYKKNVKK